jgi:hypothetical protein
MKNLRYLALGVVVGSFSACQTAAPAHAPQPNMAYQTRQAHPAHQGTAQSSRSLAAAGTSLISQFLDDMASKTSLENREAFDQAFIKMANENDSQNFKSMDDVKNLNNDDQKKLISEILDNPTLEKNLGISTDIAKQARLDALTFSDVHGIKTADVPDLQKPAGTVSDAANSSYFNKFMTANPAARVDIQEMVSESEDVKAKTGVAVINKNCDNLTSSEAMDNLELIVDGVEHDVQVGTVKTAEQVPADVEKQMSFVTGAGKEESHTRVRQLADPKGNCGVLTPAIGGF